MASTDVPEELRAVVEAVVSEFRTACGDAAATAAWLADYEVLELRAAVGSEDMEVYLPRPLLEDLANLGLAERKQVLEDLRSLPGRTRNGEGTHWLLREQGKARALRGRPFG